MSPGHKVQHGMWPECHSSRCGTSSAGMVHAQGECCTSTLHSAWGRLCTRVHPAPRPPTGLQGRVAGALAGMGSTSAVVHTLGSCAMAPGPRLRAAGLWERSAGHPHRLCEASEVCTPVCMLCPCACTVYTVRGVCVCIYTHEHTRKQGLRQASCCDAKSSGPADE